MVPLPRISPSNSRLLTAAGLSLILHAGLALLLSLTASAPSAERAEAESPGRVAQDETAALRVAVSTADGSSETSTAEKQDEGESTGGTAGRSGPAAPTEPAAPDRTQPAEGGAQDGTEPAEPAPEGQGGSGLPPALDAPGPEAVAATEDDQGKPGGDARGYGGRIGRGSTRGHGGRVGPGPAGGPTGAGAAGGSAPAARPSPGTSPASPPTPAPGRGQRGDSSETGPDWSELTEGGNVPAPEYPPVAKRFGYEGVVRVEIRIGADGTVKQVEVTASSGHGILDRHVRATILSSWSFRPPGRETAVVKEFAFRLER